LFLLDGSDVLNFCSLRQFMPSLHGHSDTVILIVGLYIMWCRPLLVETFTH